MAVPHACTRACVQAFVRSCVRVIDTAELFRAIATLFAPAVVKNNESSGGCWLGSTSFDEFDDHAFLRESPCNIRLDVWRHRTGRIRDRFDSKFRSHGSSIPDAYRVFFLERSRGKATRVLVSAGNAFPVLVPQLGSFSKMERGISPVRGRKRVDANTLGAVFFERFRSSLEFGEGLYACFEGLWPVGS